MVPSALGAVVEVEGCEDREEMHREDFSFKSPDGTEVACYRWPAEAKPFAVLQISHGMGEHALRYEHVAKVMADAGFHVYANDHRGHGRTAKDRESLGDFGAGGWDALVGDIVELTRIAHSRENGLPVALLGHSMGSFALQQCLLDHSDLLAAAILSGSASIDRLPIDPSRPFDLRTFNKEFEPARTPYDWLSRDSAVVDAFISDPLCGFDINPRSIESFATSSRRLNDVTEIAHIRHNLPIYVLAGKMDPINLGLEWLKPLVARYRAAGITNVTERYYAGGRHEMLNETNRIEVLEDLLRWLRRTLRARQES